VRSHSENIRVLAVVSTETRVSITRQLAPLQIALDCVSSVAEIPSAVRDQGSFEVAIVPATLPDLEWWELWGQLCMLEQRPAILVYTRAPTFHLWTAVLDLGGYDVIVEPFSDEEVQAAVLNAAQSFRERTANDPS
jgi:DNA-binding response OmpR family regulator